MSWEAVEGKSNEIEEVKIPYTKFESGKTTLIRVLDDEPYSFWNHWLQKQQTSVICPGKDCPICAIIHEQKANNLEKTYSSAQRHAIRVWNYTTNQMEIMIQGRTFFSQLLTLHREIGNLKSYDVKVVRHGEGTNTTYTILPTAVTEFEKNDEVSEVDWKEILKPQTPEVIQQLIEGKTYAEIFANED